MMCFASWMAARSVRESVGARNAAQSSVIAAPKMTAKSSDSLPVEEELRQPARIVFCVAKFCEHTRHLRRKRHVEYVLRHFPFQPRRRQPAQIIVGQRCEFFSRHLHRAKIIRRILSVTNRFKTAMSSINASLLRFPL